MRIEILDDEGNVINTIWATEEFAEAMYPGHWRIYIEPQRTTPQEEQQDGE